MSRKFQRFFSHPRVVYLFRCRIVAYQKQKTTNTLSFFLECEKRQHSANKRHKIRCCQNKNNTMSNEVRFFSPSVFVSCAKRKNMEARQNKTEKKMLAFICIFNRLCASCMRNGKESKIFVISCDCNESLLLLSFAALRRWRSRNLSSKIVVVLLRIHNTVVLIWYPGRFAGSCSEICFRNGLHSKKVRSIRRVLGAFDTDSTNAHRQQMNHIAKYNGFKFLIRRKKNENRHWYFIEICTHIDIHR